MFESGLRGTTLLVVGALAACAAAAGPRPAATAAAAGFPANEIADGAGLAAIGGCAGCHTRSDGAPLAGGAPVRTPFGTVYGSNITPDRATGIGAWSLADFARAMRTGVAPGGRHLYPAFPYDHFTRVDDADIVAIYAFLMTRRPVARATPAPRMDFPFGFRPLIAVWNALYLDEARYEPVPGRSAEWNRGAYLVEGLGHCGDCHTPRNLLGAERSGRPLAGAVLNGWYAPPLTAASPAPLPWTADALATYLRTGFDARHQAAAGPMGGVVHDFGAARPSDLRAIAAYLATTMAASPGAPVADRAAAADRAQPEAAALFAGACAGCHGAGAPMMQQGRPSLALGSPLHEATGADTIAVVLFGVSPPTGPPGPFMPGFAASLSDAQVAELVDYIHARFGGGAAWRDLPALVRQVRKEGSGG